MRSAPGSCHNSSSGATRLSAAPAHRRRRPGCASSVREPVVLDLLDPGAVRAAVAEARPDAIVHQATALAGLSDFKHFDRSFEPTNRLRTSGTDALLAAARESGVDHVVGQSYAGWPYAREGGPVKNEDDPLDPTPVRADARDAGRDPASRGQHRRVRAGLRFATAGSTGLPTTRSSSPYASVASRSSETATASGHSSISTMLPLPRCSRSNAVQPGSTTSSTTSPRRCGSGCPRSQQRSARSRHGASHAGSRASRQARPASS